MQRLKWIRRLMEAFLVFVCVYTFVFNTPAGELLRYGTNLVLGNKTKRRSLVSFFDTLGAESQKQDTAKRLAKPLNPKDPLFAEAQTLGISPLLARALFASLSEGQLALDGNAKIKLSAAGQRSLKEVGISDFHQTTQPAQRRLLLLKGVAELTKKFKSEDAAITALHLDWPLVEYALNRAKAAGMKSFKYFDTFARFIPASERKKVQAQVSSVFALETAFGLQSPVQGKPRISSRFGYRIHPVLKKRKKHTGIDLAIPTGTPLYASASGKIVYAGSDGINGKFIKIDHGHGLSTAYCHASKLLVKRGQIVKTGQKIALSGMTGRATGPHLHYQVEIDDLALDPELFVKSFARPKPVTLGPKVDRHGRGFTEGDRNIAHRRRRYGESKIVDQLKLRGI